MALTSSHGEARSSSRWCAATRMLDIGWLPFSSVTKPSVGNTVSVYFSFTGSGYFWSRSQTVRARAPARSQVTSKVASPRKRGSPPGAKDCPGSQNLASPLMARLFNPRSSAPPCAATACFIRLSALPWANAGCCWLIASSNADINSAFFIALLSYCGLDYHFFFRTAMVEDVLCETISCAQTCNSLRRASPRGLRAPPDPSARSQCLPGCR